MENIVNNQETAAFVYADRPTCLTEGCNKLCQNTRTREKPLWRKYCASCHKKRGKNYRKKIENLTQADYPTCKIMNCSNHVTLLGTDHDGNLKFSETCEVHGYVKNHLRWRKTYCENRDGRLGFKCTANIHFDPPLPKDCEWTIDYGFPQPMLQVDHIDGNPYNEPDDGSNFQTLCANCHSFKSWKNGDGQTPGRKLLKEET